MSPLLYIWKRTIINGIKELRHKPGRLVAYILLLALIVFMFVSSSFETPDNSPPLLPLSALGAIVFLLYAFIFVSQIFQGLNNGASFFGMEDVNLLFVSPIKAARILVYGVFKQMGTALLVAVFLLFQVATLRNMFGVAEMGVVYIFLGYALTYILAQMASLLVYSFTSGNSVRKKLVTYIMYGIIGALLVYFAVCYLSTGDILSVAEAANSFIVECIPGPGFLKGFAFGLIGGRYVSALVFLALTAVLWALIFLRVRSMDTDYYEDVLQAAERGFSVREAAKSGRVAETGGKVKLNSAGIAKGWGASVFFHKHMLENRRNGVFLLDKSSLGLFAGVAFFSIIALNEMDAQSGLLILFAFMTYMQVFLQATGRLNKELPVHYIYLVPQSSLKKLMYCALEALIRAFMEGVIIFVVLGIILKSEPAIIAILILARVSFSLYFVSGNMLMERLFGSMSGKGLALMLYFLTMIVIMLPGIAALLLLYLLAGWALPLCFMVLIAYNVLVSVAILALSKDILHNIELNTQ